MLAVDLDLILMKLLSVRDVILFTVIQHALNKSLIKTLICLINGSAQTVLSSDPNAGTEGEGYDFYISKLI